MFYYRDRFMVNVYKIYDDKLCKLINICTLEENTDWHGKSSL